MNLQDLVDLITLRNHAQNLTNGLRGDLKLDREMKNKLWTNIVKIDQIFLDSFDEVISDVEKFEKAVKEEYQKLFENTEGLAYKDPALKVKTMDNVVKEKTGFIKTGVTENVAQEESLKSPELSLESESKFKEQLAKLSEEIDFVFSDPVECSKEEFTKKIGVFFGAKGKVAELNTLLKNMSTESMFTCAKQLNELKASFEKRKKQKLENYKNK